MPIIRAIQRLVGTPRRGALVSPIIVGLGLAWTNTANAAVVHFWKLDDNAASTTVVATSGSNGTFTENTDQNRTTGPGGRIPYALTFDGNDTVTISGVSFASNATWSFSTWARFNAANGQLVGDVNSGQNRIYKSSDTNLVAVMAGAFQNYTVPSLGTSWHHILVTHSAAGTVRVWVDGVESSTGAQTISGSFTVPTIGSGNTNYLSGDVAWLKFYDTDESANVAAIYAERNTVPLLNQLQLMH